MSLNPNSSSIEEAFNYTPYDDEFRFNDVSTHEGHLRQNGELTWFCNLLKRLACFKNISMLSVGTFSNKYLRSFVWKN